MSEFIAHLGAALTVIALGVSGTSVVRSFVNSSRIDGLEKTMQNVHIDVKDIKNYLIKE